MIELFTDRLKIRGITEQDWAYFLYSHSNDELNKYVRTPRPESEIRKKFDILLQPVKPKRGESKLFCIESIKPNIFIGFVGLNCLDNELSQAEVGYMLHENAQGQGYATESLQAVVDWACIALNIHKFIAFCDVENVASSRVLEKCGFKREGILRHNNKIGERWADDHFYGLLSHERR